MRWPRFFSLLLVLLGLGFSAIAMADEPAKTQPNEAAQRLATKLVELDALQREVDQLRLELGRQPQLLFSIKTVEVNLTKMDNLGIDYAVAKEGLPNPASNNGVAESAEQLFCNKGILEALVQKNVARLVSDPTLVTVSGRPAHFCEGGEVPVGVGPDGNVTTKVLGTEVELLGTVTATNTIQLKIKASNSKLDHAHPVMINGRKQPGLRIQAIETAMEMKSGETRCLMGPTRERTETSLHEGGHTTSEVVRIQTIYLVTAELVEPFPQAPAMVRTDGQQAPQPAQSGYAESPGGGLRTTPASLQQVPMLDAIAINVDVLELSLTKLRNLGYFDGHYIQWMAALGLTDVEQSRKDQDAEPAKPAFALVEDLAKFEQNVKSMRDRDAVTIVSRPRLITLNGQSASIAVQSVGSRRKLYAFPAPAIGPLPPLAEEASLLLPNMNPAPNVAQQLFGSKRLASSASGGSGPIAGAGNA